jgi:hypothetical protein
VGGWATEVWEGSGLMAGAYTHSLSVQRKRFLWDRGRV